MLLYNAEYILNISAKREMTLTEAAFWTRRFGVLIGGAVGLFIVTAFVIVIWPDPNPLPNYLQPDFKCTTTSAEFASHQLALQSLQLAEGSDPLYEIDTQTGTLERLPLIANVYKYSNPGAILSAQSEAKEIAARFGFNPDNIQRSATHYYWTENDFGLSLQVEINTLNFRLTGDFRSPTTLPESGSLPTSLEAKTIASGFLRANGWLLEDYQAEEPVTIDINIEPDGTFSEAKSRSEAELIRVDFVRSKPFLTVRSDIDGAELIKESLEQEYQDYETSVRVMNTDDGKIDLYEFNTVVVNQDTQKSNISVYVGPEDDRKKTDDGPPDIYAIDYSGWVIETDSCGTYPLISATELTTRIENGEGSLVYLNENNGDDVVPYQPKRVSNFSVKQVTIGYLDLTQQQKFLQPVYIVSGEATLGTGITGTFYYYIPAIDYTNLRDPIIEETPVVTEEDNNSPF